MIVSTDNIVEAGSSSLMGIALSDNVAGYYYIHHDGGGSEYYSLILEVSPVGLR